MADTSARRPLLALPVPINAPEKIDIAERGISISLGDFGQREFEQETPQDI